MRRPFHQRSQSIAVVRDRLSQPLMSVASTLAGLLTLAIPCVLAPIWLACAGPANAAELAKGPVVRSGTRECEICPGCCLNPPPGVDPLPCGHLFNMDFVATTPDVLVIVKNLGPEFQLLSWSGDLCGDTFVPIISPDGVLAFLMHDLQVGTTQTFSLDGLWETTGFNCDEGARKVEIAIYEYFPPPSALGNGSVSSGEEAPAHPKNAHEAVKQATGDAPGDAREAVPVCVWECPTCPTPLFSSWILDFGVVHLGSSTQLSLTVENCQPTLLTGSFPNLASTEFMLLGDPTYNLALGESKTFVFQFQPTLTDVSVRVIDLPCSDQFTCLGTNMSCVVLLGQGFDQASSTDPIDEMNASRSGRLQVVPNPVATTTAVRYVLDEAGPVRVQIFDVAGRLVRTLVDGRASQGTHTTHWDRTRQSGVTVAEGVYYLRVTTPRQDVSRAVVVLR